MPVFLVTLLSDGDSVYSRENQFKCLGTPKKTCFTCTRTPVKNLLEFLGVVIIVSLISCVCVRVPFSTSRYVRYTATHCNTLQHTATHCNTLQHTATHCDTQHATHCITMQHTATHCTTLQHTATHCTTLQHAHLVYTEEKWVLSHIWHRDM